MSEKKIDKNIFLNDSINKTVDKLLNYATENQVESIMIDISKNESAIFFKSSGDYLKLEKLF